MTAMVERIGERNSRMINFISVLPAAIYEDGKQIINANYRGVLRVLSLSYR